MPHEPRPFSPTTSAALCVLLAALHGAVTWFLLGGAAGLRAPYPFFYDDHAFQYYYAVTSRAYLEQSGSTAGYDPYFMAGYAKSILFPSSSTLAEWLVFLVGGSRPELVYKLYVLTATAAGPWLLWPATHAWLGRGKRQSDVEPRNRIDPFAASPAVLLLYLWCFWSSMGGIYMLEGMVAFNLSAPFSLLAGGLAVRFLEEGGFRRWLSAAVAASLAPLVHLCAAVALAPGLVAAPLVLEPKSWPRRFGLLLILALALAVNLHWILPGWLLRSTLGETATGIGFINPNVGERLVEFFHDRPLVEPAILILAAIGTFACVPRRRRIVLAAGLGWTFFLGYFAGFFRSFDWLQPGRYTLYFFVWGTLPAGALVAGAFGWIARRTGRPLVAAGVALAAIGSVLVTSFPPSERQAAREVLRGNVAISQAPRLQRTLLERLARHVRPGQRIFFEERNTGFRGPQGILRDPIGRYRLAPLLPLLLGVEVIGGPYLYTHLQTNFTQVGDGRFLGSDDWNAERVRKYAALYDVDLLVAWSPPARAFAKDHPEQVEILEVVADWYFIARLKPAPAEESARPGSAVVNVRPGRLEVRDIRTKDGLVVLPYHWTPRLVTRPHATIEPISLLEDPVPFIGLRDPPPEVLIELDPW